MRGLELISRLRANNSFLRTIVISGQVDHDDLEPHELEKELKESVAVDRYLPKPVSAAQVDTVIHELLAGPDVRPSAVDWKSAAQEAQRTQAVTKKSLHNIDKAMRRRTRGKK